MPYIEGKTLNSASQDINIETLLKLLDKTEKVLYDLSSHKAIMMDDLHPDNVILTPNNEFKFVDTDQYSFNPSEETRDIFNHNIYEWGNLILGIYADGYPFIDQSINDAFERCVFYGESRPSYIINKLYELIQKEYKKDITTIDEYNEGLKLVRKYKDKN